MIRSFSPVIGKNPRILILGSMPGQRSLDEHQYYAHPRNAFWPIMGELFGAGPELPYEKRLKALGAAGVALWDVLESCQRSGSLDTAIDAKTAVPNDFARLFRAQRSIRRVYFNGGAAASLYRRRVLPDIELVAPYVVHAQLPSTSPAHAAMNFDEKLARWSALVEA